MSQGGPVTLHSYHPHLTAYCYISFLIQIEHWKGQLSKRAGKKFKKKKGPAAQPHRKDDPKDDSKSD